MKKYLTLALIATTFFAFSQEELAVMDPDPHYVKPESLIDPVYGIVVYEKLNSQLGGDSTRHCKGYACTGWVEDRYENGDLMHKGYYSDGQLVMYKNYYPNGELEREFKMVDNLKCQTKLYYPNGEMKSYVKYHRGDPFIWQDFYENGQIQYDEELNKQTGTYVLSNTYAANGIPISTLELENKKRMEFSHKEFHVNGQVKLEGKTRYISSIMDHRRVGIWKHYNLDGVLTKEDTYVNGKVQKERKY